MTVINVSIKLLDPKEDCKPESVYMSPKENTLEDLKSTLKDLKNYT